MPNSQLHEAEVFDLSVLCLIHILVLVQVDNYVTHSLPGHQCSLGDGGLELLYS